ncbi:MAG: protein kinase family protein, partial [Pseudomonadota bacterium]
MKCTACGTDLPEDAAFCSTCGKATGITGDVDQMLTIGGLQTEFAHDTEGRKAVRQAELEPGSVFADRFTIQSLIGRGGMGVVYAAKDRVTEQDIALKLIRRDRLSGPEAVRKLVREGVTTRDIRHPNIVSVYDVGETDGQPYMSMELLAGQSLRQWIRDRARAREDVPFPVAEQIV